MFIEKQGIFPQLWLLFPIGVKSGLPARAGPNMGIIEY
jgi:hypothetical protein